MSVPAASLVADLTSLIGDRTLVLHTPAMDEIDVGMSGRDVDCAIVHLDPMWPLRLAGGWRLCQSLHYDLRGWYWVLERDGQVLALDGIEDPLGLGRDAIPTTSFVDDQEGEPSPAARAAYLTVKRLRKGMLEPREWSRIGGLASGDPDRYQRVLARIGGERFASVFASFGLEGSPPSRSLVLRAEWMLRRRRFGSVSRAASALTLGARRYVERVMRPTGMVVLVSGPDGSGKSTLAEDLPGLLEGVFKRYQNQHWRPNLLPRPGSFLARVPNDPTKPHARRAYGRAVSLALLGYYWMDFFLGGWFLHWEIKIRTGLMVRERGWWDIGVDPRRYRLDVPARLVRVLGATLNRPDLALVLEGHPDVLAARKKELAGEEIERQSSAWREILPPSVPALYVDGGRPYQEVARIAREAVLQCLERRAVSRLGAGWTVFPGGRSTRWWIPRGSRPVVKSAITVYQPVTIKGRVGWEAARILATFGGFRLTPRADPPPRALRALLGPHLPPRSTLAVTRANHPGRYVALVLGLDGKTRAMAKVATDEHGIEALEREAKAIGSLGPLLPSPIDAPRILASEPGVLLLEPIPWRPRARPWELEEEVARAMGGFFHAGARQSETGPVGPVHGDFAPWNLLRTAGWGLVDWESADEEGPLFHDLCHYLVQAHTLLGRPSREHLLGGFRGKGGWVGNAVRAHADAVGIDPVNVEPLLRDYLIRSQAGLRATTKRERQGLLARRALLRDLRG